jgi:hypothetical protein
MSTIGHNKPHVSVASLSDADKTKLKEAIKELDGSMTRVAAERDHQKAVLADIHEKLGIDKKIARRMAKVYFKANFQEEQDEYNQFEEMYKEVLG